MIAIDRSHKADLAALAEQAHDLCLLHASNASLAATLLQRNSALAGRTNVADYIEGALRETLHDSPVDPDLYELAHEEDRELVAQAVDDGCCRARAELNGALDEGCWKGLTMAILYRFAW